MALTNRYIHVYIQLLCSTDDHIPPCIRYIHACLQPLMVCMSYPATMKLVDRLCEDYDVPVQFWSDDLLSNLDDDLS